MQYCDVITNPRWRTAAILKIAKSPYLSKKSSDFDKIWYTKADIEPDDSPVTKKIEILKIQDGGGRHLENLLAITHRPIVSEILYEKAKRHVDEGYMTKTANF